MNFIILVLEVLLAFGLALGLASFCTWVERKGSALIQNRIGANRAGAFAETNVLLLKPFYFGWRLLGRLGVINTLLCDGLKALFKEDFVPQGASSFLHALAPFLAVVPVFMAFAVLPLAPEFNLFGYHIRPQAASFYDGGVLFLLAMGALSVYGVLLAGWVGNNKFSLLGALRAAAQMFSYELPMGVALGTVILVYGTTDLYQMVESQSGLWGIMKSPMMFVAGLIFFVSGMAQTKRVPFDLPESEAEIVAGYLTEYSGMKFLLFWLAEFAEIALVSLVMVLVFFGGWHPFPFVSLPSGSWQAALAGHFILLSKVVFFCVLQITIRWTLPRFRYDQLMNLSWKGLLEVGFVNLISAAAWKLAA